MDAQEYVATQHGSDINQFGGIYTRGKAYDYLKKVKVATAYIDAKAAAGGRRVNVKRIAQQCKVGWYYVYKVKRELQEHGQVLKQKDIPRRHAGPIGPGSKSIGEVGAFILYLLYSEEPSRTLSSYVAWLEILLGVVVHESTVSRVFKEAFPFSAGLYRPNLVPYDKFRPANLERAMEYLLFIARVDPSRIKYADEKLLKGQELFNRDVRRDPFTGIIPPVLTPADFRNTYVLTGFCGIDGRGPSLFYRMHDANNDATQFSMDLEDAIEYGFFHPGDILVMDNAAYHTGGENTVLANWLWSRHGIFLLFLPARFPELNPMEQIWKTLVRRLKNFPLDWLKVIQENGVRENGAVIAAYIILACITREEIVRMYRHCGLV